MKSKEEKRRDSRRLKCVPWVDTIRNEGVESIESIYYLYLPASDRCATRFKPLAWKKGQMHHLSTITVGTFPMPAEDHRDCPGLNQCDPWVGANPISAWSVLVLNRSRSSRARAPATTIIHSPQSRQSVPLLAACLACAAAARALPGSTGVDQH